VPCTLPLAAGSETQPFPGDNDGEVAGPFLAPASRLALATPGRRAAADPRAGARIRVRRRADSGTWTGDSLPTYITASPRRLTLFSFRCHLKPPTPTNAFPSPGYA